ncbi:MAG: DNA-directed RNA polymerase subunit A'' [Candidatus Aenigmatarchaeota archaeon]
MIELPIRIKELIEKVSKKYNFSEEQKKKLEEAVRKAYEKVIFEPQEAIGILTAQSISEPATQATMRVYHVAGAVGIKITLGLPRLIELFDARKDISTPSMTIYLKKEYNNEKDAYRVASSLIQKKIGEVSRIYLNLTELSLEIEPEEQYFEEVYEFLKEKIKLGSVKKKGKRIEIIPRKEYSIKELRRLRDRIGSMVFKGIKGIETAIVYKEKDDWIIQTIGSNLKEVLQIEEVDETRTISNNPHEVAEVLGIEAARNLLLMEVMKVLQQQGLDVNLRFLFIIADTMTFNGTISPIGRYGVAGRKYSILARAGFEETVKNIVNASVRRAKDELKSSFENLMIGNVVPIGTGAVEITLRENGNRKDS